MPNYLPSNFNVKYNFKNYRRSSMSTNLGTPDLHDLLITNYQRLDPSKNTSLAIDNFLGLIYKRLDESNAAQAIFLDFWDFRDYSSYNCFA